MREGFDLGNPGEPAPLAFGRFNGEPRAVLAAKGLALAEIVDQPERSIELHSHNSAHFCYLLQGRYLTGARSAAGCCGPGTMLFHPAGTRHRDRFHPDSRGGRFLALSIADETVALAGGHSLLVPGEVAFTSGELPALGSRLYRELRWRDEVSPLVLEGLALELLALAARETRRAEACSPAWLAKAHERICDGFRSRLTVRQLAASLGVDPLQLGRGFRRRYGCSPGELLRQCRVRRAAELLRDPAARLADVALECGFADQAQLTKSFQRITGTTPGRYRKLIAS